MRCPYLGLEGDRSRALSEAASLHRCYRPGRPERVGISYQAQVCLGPGHLRCPRLGLLKGAEGTEGQGGSRAALAVSAGAATSAKEAVLHRAVSEQTLRVPETLRVRPEGGGATRAVSEQTLRVPETLRVPPLREDAPRVGGRQPVTVIELAVIGLGISVVFACLFVGLAAVYRLRVGPGMSAGPDEAAVSRGLPTLVPTFTPIITAAPAADQGGTAAPVTVVPPTATVAVTATVAPPSRPPATSPPTRLVIPKIGLDIPVLPVGTRTTRVGGRTRTVWGDVPNAGGFHDSSAYPGNPGNTVINGHRDILGAVFRHLDSVAIGDEITLYVGEVAYPYRVVEVLVVPEVFASASQRAENLRLIGYMPEERLTLVTCTPVALATHRLLVIAWPAATSGTLPAEAQAAAP